MRRKILERTGIYRILPLHRLPLSLSMKILMVLLLIVIVGFIVTLRLSLALIYDNIWRETEEKLSTDLNICSMMYDNALDDVEAVVDFTANRFFLTEGIEAGKIDELRVQLEAIRRDRHLDVLTLTDDRGVVLLRTAPPYATGDNVQSDVLLSRALAGKGAKGTMVLSRERMAKESEDLAMRAHVVVKEGEYTQPGALSEVNSGMFMMAAYPVYSAQGKKLGALYGGKLLNNDFSLVDSIKQKMFPEYAEKNTHFAMVSVFFWDVRVSTTVKLDNGNRAAGFRMYSEVTDSVINNGRDWFGTSWVVKDWYFAAYQPIRDPEGKVIGSLGVGVWKGPFIALRDDFINRFVKISALGLAASLVLGLLFSRMLTKPLRELVEASDELAKGNLDYRVAIKDSKDEIRDLELAFNQMAKNLHVSMKEKITLARELSDLNQRYMELLGFASHELKQPIGVIAVSLATLRKTGPFTSPDQFDKIIDRLERNIAYISSMSEKYLHYSKIESGQLQLYQKDTRVLADIIEPVLEGEQKTVLEKEMRVEIPDKAKLARLELFVDPEMIRVVFANLISNAVKYGYQGGYIQIGYKETDDAYRFNVKNNGEGIPLDKLEEIFEKFKRLENVRGKHKGTGLGLFNAKEIVELHGGEIWAESEPGKWADLFFELPKKMVNISRHNSSQQSVGEELWGY